MRKKCADNFKEELSASSARGPLLPVSRLFFTFNNSFCHKFSFAWYPSVCTSVCMLTHRGRCVFVDKWKLMKQRVAFFAMERNLADYSNNTWLWSSEMSLAVVQRYEAVRKDVEKKKNAFFLCHEDFTKTSHVPASFLQEDVRRWGVICFRRREKTGIICLCLSMLFSGY